MEELGPCDITEKDDSKLLEAAVEADMETDVEAAVEASVAGVVCAEAVDNNTRPRRSTPRPLYAELANVSMDLFSAMEAINAEE